MPPMKNLNKIKELKIRLNNIKKNYNIVKMKIKLIKVEENLGMMKDLLSVKLLVYYRLT